MHGSSSRISSSATQTHARECFVHCTWKLLRSWSGGGPCWPGQQGSMIGLKPAPVFYLLQTACLSLPGLPPRHCHSAGSPPAGEGGSRCAPADTTGSSTPSAEDQPAGCHVPAVVLGWMQSHCRRPPKHSNAAGCPRGWHTCRMELFWLQSTMGLLASLCTSSEKVKWRLPTARATSSLCADSSSASTRHAHLRVQHLL